MENASISLFGMANLTTVISSTEDIPSPTVADHIVTVFAVLIATILLVTNPVLIGAYLHSELCQLLKVMTTNLFVSEFVSGIALYLVAFQPYFGRYDYASCMAVQVVQFIAISSFYVAVFCQAFLAWLVVEKPFLQTSISLLRVVFVFVGIWITDIGIILVCSFAPSSRELSSRQPYQCTFSSIPRAVVYVVDFGIVFPASISAYGFMSRLAHMSLVKRRQVDSIKEGVAPSGVLLDRRLFWKGCFTWIFSILYTLSHGGIVILMHLSVFCDVVVAWQNRTVSLVFFTVVCLHGMCAAPSKVLRDGFNKMKRSMKMCCGA